MRKRLLLGVLAAMSVISSAAAQSLADVARAEEARRKAVKTRSKVYTNDTVGGSAQQAPATSIPAAAAQPQSPASNAPASAAKPAPPQPAEPAKDEKYWRTRVTIARGALERSENFASALESQINALYTEFVNMSDPAQRALIEQKRLASIAEHDRVKADIIKHKQEIQAILDEARRANAPPGWLR